jgi:transposase
MYIRRDRQKQKGKTPATYLSIAHSVVEESKKGKRTKPVVLANLGNEEDLNPKMVSQLIRSLEKYAHQRWGDKPGSAAVVHQLARELKPNSRALRLVCAKQLGMRLLVERAWKKLGIGKALARFEKKHRCEFPIERIIFAMVLNRLVDPKSKYAANRWVKTDVYFPEADDWQVQHFYRALDVLHEHWNELEDGLARELQAMLAPEERELLLTDTTTLYFEARQNDAEIAELADAWHAADNDTEAKDPKRKRPRFVNKPPFRMQGHNKDGHPGDPQVVIASVCSPNGFVLWHRTYPGNTSDFTVARDLIGTLPKLAPRTERMWVSDAGMLAKEHISLLDKARWGRLSAEGPRRSGKAQSLLSRATPGKYKSHSKKEHLGYKVVELSADESDSGKPEKWVITRNERERERKLARIERHLDRTAEVLGKQKAPAHPRSVCQVVSHPSLRRYVKASEKVTGSYVFDQKAIQKERQLAGVRFLRTTKLDWDGERIFETYQALQKVESNHKLFKGPLRLQPCYHSTTDRIQAHVMLTILATNCARYLERETGRSIAGLTELFKGLLAARMADGKREHWECSEMTTEQQAVLEMLGIGAPPRVWDEWIEVAKAKPKQVKNKAGSHSKARRKGR